MYSGNEKIGGIEEALVESSHEYKQSLSVPFNYALQTGWGQGLAEARSEEELREIMMRMNGFDPYSDKKMNAEYERAEEVAGSTNTVSREFSKSKTGPSLQDPVSEPTSGGSKAPPSKKT
ncbi:hypothetical protein Tco_0764318 [Tanacetum coccineum]